MKVGYKKLGLVLGAVAALAILPARADAQFVRYSPIFWSVEGGAGIAIPLGDLSDVSSSGVTTGVGVSYFLNPRFALRAEGSIDFMGEGDLAPADPDLQIWHFTGGFEYHVADPMNDFMFVVDAGAGGVTFDTEIFQVADFPNAGDTSTGSFSKTFFAANGGVKLGYNLARHGSTNVPMITLYVNGDFHLMFTSEDDTALFAAYNGTTAFGTTFSLPITAGLRINFP